MKKFDMPFINFSVLKSAQLKLLNIEKLGKCLQSNPFILIFIYLFLSSLQPQLGTEFDRVALAIAGTMIVKMKPYTNKHVNYGSTTNLGDSYTEEPITLSNEPS